MLSKDELAKMAEKYQAKADTAYRNYQETGISRYDRERRNNEDLADALSAAANSAEEHLAYANLRAEVIWYAGCLDNALFNRVDHADLVKLVNGFIDMAASACNLRRIGDIEHGKD